MKKNTVKGFVLVESMVVIVFLATMLLSLYSSFNTVLDNAKRRIYYDDVVYMYRAYYVLNYLEKNEVFDYVEEKFSNRSGEHNERINIAEFGCHSTSLVKNRSSFCENLRDKFEIERLFITYYDVNGIIQCMDSSDLSSSVELNCKRNSALQNLSNGTVNYMYTLDGYSGTEDSQVIYDASRSGYRLIIEFKKEKQKEYEYYDYMSESFSNDISTNTKKETISNNEYYYATLKIPFGVEDKQCKIDRQENPSLPKCE